MSENPVFLTLEQWQTLAVFHARSGATVDDSVASALEKLGLVTTGWVITEAGEKAYLENRDRYADVRPKRNFIG
jgi:predicted DNA-binding ArsR family transcriptional regulator